MGSAALTTSKCLHRSDTLVPDLRLPRMQSLPVSTIGLLTHAGVSSGWDGESSGRGGVSGKEKEKEKEKQRNLKTKQGKTKENKVTQGNTRENEEQQ